MFVAETSSMDFTFDVVLIRFFSFLPFLTPFRRIASTCQLWSASGTLAVYNVASAGKPSMVPIPAFHATAISTAKRITTGE